MAALVISDRRRRRYRLLFEDPRLDVWVLSWMPGQETGFHDHGASNVALTALQGTVLERQMRLGGPSIERELSRARSSRARPATSTRSRIARASPP